MMWFSHTNHQKFKNMKYFKKYTQSKAFNKEYKSRAGKMSQEERHLWSIILWAITNQQEAGEPVSASQRQSPLLSMHAPRLQSGRGPYTFVA